jgi:hypothetical protein
VTIKIPDPIFARRNIQIIEIFNNVGNDLLKPASDIGIMSAPAWNIGL